MISQLYFLINVNNTRSSGLHPSVKIFSVKIQAANPAARFLETDAAIFSVKILTVPGFQSCVRRLENN